MRIIDTSQENRSFSDLAPNVARNALFVSVFGILASLILTFMLGGGLERFFQSYLVNFGYFLSLTLGALFFVIIQHVVRASWSVVVRRVAEVLSSNFLLMAILFLPVIAGMDHLFHWLDPHAVDDEILAGKLGYLNRTFFILRWVLYFGIWAGLARFFYTNSVKQDETGDIKLTLRMEKFSPLSVILFAFSLTFASFDLLMSINPHWYSTIFGVYYFAGSVLGSFAMFALIFHYLHKKGRLLQSVTLEHFHDIGKLMFAFTVFWAYIGFSQYMLYWYGNIPEETVWFLHRQTGSWTPVTWFILFGHFVVPFLGLLSRIPKRRSALLRFIALYVLAVHWIDIYWIAMPEWFNNGVSFHLLDLTLFLAIGGLWISVAARRLGRASLVPSKDPRLSDSLAFENS